MSQWYPPPFEQYISGTHIDREFGPNLDLAIKNAYDRINNLSNSVLMLPAGTLPQAIANGSTVVTGSMKGVATGLSSVSNVVGSVDNGSSAHAFTLTLTPSATAGAIDVYCWMPTASGDTTPTTATSPVTVRWAAFGAQ